MNPGNGKRCTYVCLSSLSTANRPNQIRVYQLGFGLTYPLDSKHGYRDHRGADILMTQQLLNRPDS